MDSKDLKQIVAEWTQDESHREEAWAVAGVMLRHINELDSEHANETTQD